MTLWRKLGVDFISPSWSNVDEVRCLQRVHFLADLCAALLPSFLVSETFGQAHVGQVSLVAIGPSAAVADWCAVLRTDLGDRGVRNGYWEGACTDVESLADFIAECVDELLSPGYLDFQVTDAQGVAWSTVENPNMSDRTDSGSSSLEVCREILEASANVVRFLGRDALAIRRMRFRFAGAWYDVAPNSLKAMYVDRVNRVVGVVRFECTDWQRFMPETISSILVAGLNELAELPGSDSSRPTVYGLEIKV